MSESGDLPPTFVKDFHDVEYVKKMKYNKFGQTDLVVSVLGFGGSAIGGCFNVTEDAHSIEVVHEAIRKGINYIDTAPWYGNGRAEAVLGQALKGLPRQAYYVATKVGRYEPDIEKMFDFTSQRTYQSVEESLNRLGINCIDLIQIHDVEFAPNVDIIVNETLPALDKLKQSGKVKYIGITGYSLESLKCILEKSEVKIDSVLSYCRYTLFDTSLTNYLPFFKTKELGIVNAAIVGMGLLSDGGPAVWHPATQEIRLACEEAAKYCKSLGVNISKLAVHFSLLNNDIHTHLVSVASLELLKKNLETLWKNLTPPEEETLKFVREKYFMKLECTHWEGIEVQQYREKSKELGTKYRTN